ncbi:MAG: VOC family protein [Beijerinckiaceae bacterium]|jgi:catechol 2,3-dioxygenase|nr:VOC family protein [Beijerinckiaceae bacterium]
MDAFAPVSSARLESEQSPIFPLAATLVARDAPTLARFYVDVLGFERIAERDGNITLGAGGVGFLTLQHCPEARANDGRGSGLFHIAYLVPSRAELGRWFLATHTAGAPFDGASDHAVSEAFYLTDPEGNGIEVYVDRKRAEWPREGEGYAMDTGPMAVRDIARNAGPGDETPRLPAGTRIGHFHLQVGDVDRAAAWWHETLGTDETHRRPGARFHSWGGYHHHVGLNSWNSRGAGPRDPAVTGLEAVTFAVREGSEFGRLAAQSGAVVEGEEFHIREPFGLTLTFRKV